MASREALVRHPVAIAGVLLTTVSAAAFIALVIAEVAGLLPNPYAGLVVYVLLPALFVLGLLLIPLGMWLERRRRERDPSASRDWPIVDFRIPAVRRRTVLMAALTAVNVLIIVVAVAGGMHSMESPEFCGQTCHLPMHPQFTAWQSAPHSQVTCVQCHVGEGAAALVHYKMAGVRQLYHVVTGQIPKPIPGVADMRPALEVCGECHWPGRDVGEPVRVKREFADDEANTVTETRLQMLVGGPGRPTSQGRAIHWHADSAVRIEYVYSDPERQTIPYVRAVDKSGKVKEYRAEGTSDDQITKGSRRVMDCIDCHNVPAHRIAATPEQAVDAALASGDVSQRLPFVRREGVRVVKAAYSTQEEGRLAIARELRAFYESRTGVDSNELSHTITALQNVYGRNVFPSMKVTFGVYPDNIGHITSTGCFRCHDGSHAAPDGTTISADCEYCHKQLD